MKKTLLFISLIICVLQSSSAQGFSDIKKNKDYYWGEGVGATPKQAEDEALQMLIGSISVQVFTGSDFEVTQTTVDGKMQYEEKFNNIVKSYSQATLKNVEKIDWDEDNGTHVLCYILKTEVRKIFAEREAKILDFVNVARKAEKEVRIADALKYYYWGLMLLKSHPNGNTLTEDIDGKSENLSRWIPEKIGKVLDGVSFTIRDKTTEPNLTHYNLAFTYNGKPITNLEYAAHSGRSWGTLTRAQDGMGTAEMIGDNAEMHKDIRIRIEYEYGEEWRTDREIENVLPNLQPVAFRNATKTNTIQKKVEDFQYEKVNLAQNLNNNQASTPVSTASATQPQPSTPNADNTQAGKVLLSVDGTKYLPMLQKVQNAIATKNYTAAADFFTAEGYDIFNKLVKNGNAVIVAQPQYSFLQFEDGIMVRSLPMKFTFSRNRSTIENVVFDIEIASGKIRSMQFGVTANMVSELMNQTRWEEYSRVAIINFIENYQTAYALKRLDYLQSIFAEDALIIVGRRVKATVTAEQRNAINLKKYERVKYSKAQYMKNLERCFAAQEFINLKFADVSIERRNGATDEKYGIQMQQDYFSATYADQGYLFLYVDLNNPYKPIIHIRTWQEEKDSTIMTGVYNLQEF